MSKSQTVSSTPRLSEYAKSFVFPSGIKKTVWPRVEAKGAELGLGFDWWQSQLGTVCLGYGDDGKYVATVGGIGLSIPRQVGKTYFVLAMMFLLCILFPGFQVVWTSHHLRTTNKTLTTAKAMSRRKKIHPHVRTVRLSHGEGQVEFVNGSMIMFGARSQGFGRGFDEIDAEVFDEAQILDTSALEDMVAATNQARHEHGALLLFMGTPPRPRDPSEAFSQRRQKAIQGKSKNAIWLEIGADPKSSPDDKKQWPLMNPSYPKRTPPESMERLRENLADADSWNREGRGVWDDDSQGHEFPPGVWVGAGVTLQGPLRNPVVAVDVRMGVQQTLSLGVAGDADDGPVAMIARYEQRQNAQWTDEQVVGWVAAELKTRGLHEIAIDAYGENGPLIPLLEEAGLDVVKFNTVDMRNACMSFHSAILNGQLHHLSETPLDNAVMGARRRRSNDGWRWSRTDSVTNIGPLLAVAEAWWVYTTTPGYDLMDSFG